MRIQCWLMIAPPHLWPRRPPCLASMRTCQGNWPGRTCKPPMILLLWSLAKAWRDLSLLAFDAGDSISAKGHWSWGAVTGGCGTSMATKWDHNVSVNHDYPGHVVLPWLIFGLHDDVCNKYVYVSVSPALFLPCYLFISSSVSLSLLHPMSLSLSLSLLFLCVLLYLSVYLSSYLSNATYPQWKKLHLAYGRSSQHKRKGPLWMCSKRQKPVYFKTIRKPRQLRTSNKIPRWITTSG